MKHQFVIAGTLWVVALLGGAGLVVTLLTDPLFAQEPTDAFTTLVLPALVVDALVFTSTGWAIIARRPGNRIGWLLLIIGPAMVATFGGFVLGATATSQAGAHAPIAGWFSLMGGLLIFPLFTLIGFVGILFPDGRLPSSRWRVPVGLILPTLIASAAVVAVRPGEVNVGLGRNPIGIEAEVIRELAPIALSLGMLGALSSILLAALAVATRFRHASGERREQLKWFLAATSLAAAFWPPSFANSDSDPFDLLAVASLALFPISVGVAVLRYRLYEIDRIVSRTLGWATITTVIGLVFLGAILAFQALLAGVTRTNTIAIAASTLVAFALFQPVRRRVQIVVDRRFDRTRYEAAMVAEGFTSRLRGQLDLEAVRNEVTTVAVETVRPTTVSVWLRAARESQ